MAKVSIIIPAYNEERDIGECLSTLISQTYSPIEIFVVDDGSTDRTVSLVKKFQSVKLLRQNHQGPAGARNKGAKKASGEILVFVDADMTFDKDFIGELIRPILSGEVVGTFSKDEMVANSQNVWSQCWNINRGVSPERMHPENYPDEQPVFRAILKKEFEKVGGFDNIGYTDDWTLYRKLGVMAIAAPGAIFYHKNPDNFGEVWRQARWIGKNEFISGTFIRRIWSLWRYGLLVSIFTALKLYVKSKKWQVIIFKIWYDLAIWVSVLRSFFGEAKSR